MQTMNKNFCFPMGEKTNRNMVEKWHQCVEEFCRSVGIHKSNAHEVAIVRCGHDLTQPVEQELLIMRKNQEIGRIKTYLKLTAAGLKFTITCQQIRPQPSAEDEVPHEIDYDRGDGNFVTASF